jgi:hypothetical protein
MGFSLKKAWVGVRNAALAPAKLAMMPSILATKGITKGFDALTGQNKKQDQSNASSALQIGLTPEEKAQLLQPLPTVTLGKMGGQEEQAKRAQLAREAVPVEALGQAHARPRRQGPRRREHLQGLGMRLLVPLVHELVLLPRRLEAGRSLRLCSHWMLMKLRWWHWYLHLMRL